MKRPVTQRNKERIPIGDGRFGVVLDNGCIVRTFRFKTQAKHWKDQWNDRAREGKNLGHMVTCRMALGIVSYKKRKK